jgi:hypothetical protein
MVAMKKWLVECGAATSGVYRVFDHEAPIAIVYFLRDRVRFPRTAHAYWPQRAFCFKAPFRFVFFPAR